MKRQPRKFRKARVMDGSRGNLDLLDIKMLKASEIKVWNWSINRPMEKKFQKHS